MARPPATIQSSDNSDNSVEDKSELSELSELAEDKTWEYGHQDIDPTTLGCNLLDVSHARDFEDENGQTREYQFRLETWKPLEVWHFHSGKPRKKPAIVVLAQCKL